MLTALPTIVLPTAHTLAADSAATPLSCPLTTSDPGCGSAGWREPPPAGPRDPAHSPAAAAATAGPGVAPVPDPAPPHEASIPAAIAIPATPAIRPHGHPRRSLDTLTSPVSAPPGRPRQSRN